MQGESATSFLLSKPRKKIMSSVSLSDIESVSRSELSDSRLNDLEHGHSAFEKALNSSSDPIALDNKSKPYKIIDGRHRIYLARKKGYSSVNARFV
jgi:hypothetical protein